jgi:hypothetical protein
MSIGFKFPYQHVIIVNVEHGFPHFTRGLYMRNLSLVPVILLTLISYAGADESGKQPLIVREASGIVRLGDRLIIVGDDADGRYFELDLEEQRGPIIPIDPEKVREVILPGAKLAMDLEGIDVLADGRIAILSEQQRCLIAEESAGTERFTIVAEFDRTLTEFGNRGLEGFAVKKIDGGSRIAVMWEGGYPDYRSVPGQLRGLVGRLPLKPVIVVHEVRDGGVIGAVHNPLKEIQLDVPEPDGDPPIAQRLRGSDLVWYRWPGGEDEGGDMEGFIVLLTSENSPPDESGIDKSYEIKVLQRFDMDGKPVGDSLDLNKICAQAFTDYIENKSGSMGEKMLSHCKQVKSILEDSSGEEVNWEGLGWFEEGKSLIAIYDTWPKDPPFALVIDIPSDWK